MQLKYTIHALTKIQILGGVLGEDVLHIRCHSNGTNMPTSLITCMFQSLWYFLKRIDITSQTNH